MWFAGAALSLPTAMSASASSASVSSASSTAESSASSSSSSSSSSGGGSQPLYRATGGRTAACYYQFARSRPQQRVPARNLVRVPAREARRAIAFWSVHLASLLHLVGAQCNTSDARAYLKQARAWRRYVSRADRWLGRNGGDDSRLCALLRETRALLLGALQRTLARRRQRGTQALLLDHGIRCADHFAESLARYARCDEVAFWVAAHADLAELLARSLDAVLQRALFLRVNRLAEQLRVALADLRCECVASRSADSLTSVSGDGGDSSSFTFSSGEDGDSGSGSASRAHESAEEDFAREHHRARRRAHRNGDVDSCDADKRVAALHRAMRLSLQLLRAVKQTRTDALLRECCVHALRRGLDRLLHC